MYQVHPLFVVLRRGQRSPFCIMMDDIPFYPTTNLLIPLPTGAGHWSMGWAGYKAHYLIIATAPPGPLGDLVAVLLRLDLTAGPPFSQQEGPYLFVAARPLP